MNSLFSTHESLHLLNIKDEPDKKLAMKRALDSVNEKILAAVKRRAPDIVAPNRCPRLIAVSKLKPIEALIEAYECGQRYFGENYVKELEFKSNCSQLMAKCPDIRFHFIGHLQANKVNHLLKVKNLHMVETIDSIKLADLLNKAIERRRGDRHSEPPRFLTGDEKLQPSKGARRTEPLRDASFSDRLKVLIQVNTSGEEQKNGIEPDSVVELAKHIIDQCKWLHLVGFMTIGRVGGWPESENQPNKDFLRLYEIRQLVSKELAMDSKDLELSMGMSSDFEEAIELGSTNVRVGTMIFGERPSKDASNAPLPNDDDQT